MRTTTAAPDSRFTVAKVGVVFAPFVISIVLLISALRALRDTTLGADPSLLNVKSLPDSVVTVTLPSLAINSRSLCVTPPEVSCCSLMKPALVLPATIVTPPAPVAESDQPVSDTVSFAVALTAPFAPELVRVMPLSLSAVAVIETAFEVVVKSAFSVRECDASFPRYTYPFTAAPPATNSAPAPAAVPSSSSSTRSFCLTCADFSTARPPARRTEPNTSPFASVDASVTSATRTVPAGRKKREG
jgi:hypothetical protein